MRVFSRTPPPHPLPEAERGSRRRRQSSRPSARGGEQTVFLPLSASGRGLGGGVREKQRAGSASDGSRRARRLRFRLVGFLGFVLAASALTLAAQGDSKPAAPLRELSRADEQRVRELYAKALAF